MHLFKRLKNDNRKSPNYLAVIYSPSEVSTPTGSAYGIAHNVPACCHSSTQVSLAVKEEFGLDVPRQQVSLYDLNAYVAPISARNGERFSTKPGPAFAPEPKKFRSPVRHSACETQPLGAAGRTYPAPAPPGAPARQFMFTMKRDHKKTA